MKLRSLRFGALLLALATTSCAAEVRNSPVADTISIGAANLPSEWGIPAGSVVPTYATDGMISTTDRVASEIGAEILRRGGNAVDAAVATHFALAVVNPEAGNIGGGGFMVVHMADGTVASLDFREKAPLAASRDMYLDAQGNLTSASTTGHLAAGVPGSVAGMWEAHRRFGSLPWSELVTPAANLAEGIVVHERLASSLGNYQERLRAIPPPRRHSSRAAVPHGSEIDWNSGTSPRPCAASPAMAAMASISAAPRSSSRRRCAAEGESSRAPISPPTRRSGAIPSSSTTAVTA
jgi:hypothetical protein